jgi:hypothetical protein
LEVFGVAHKPSFGQKELSVQFTVGTMMMHVAHEVKLAAADLNVLVAAKPP